MQSINQAIPSADRAVRSRFSNRRKSWLWPALLAPLVLMVGCASLSKSECLKGDWFNVGLKDASDGHPPSHLDEDVKACAEYGVKIDYPVYGRGYRQGLLSYCTPSNGFSEGRYGRTYYNQCPQETERAFLAAWAVGSDLNDIESAIGDLTWRIGHAQNQIDDKDTSDDKRRELRRDIRQMQYELRQREADSQAALDRARSLGY
ncbi:DUF2799 domain-containing protein [soil metagenome]